MFNTLKTEIAAVKSLLDQLHSILGKRWMVAFFVVDDAKDDFLKGRVSWNFPHDKNDECLDWLIDDLRGLPIESPTPLAEANIDDAVMTPQAASAVVADVFSGGIVGDPEEADAPAEFYDKQYNPVVPEEERSDGRLDMEAPEVQTETAQTNSGENTAEAEVDSTDD